MRFRLVALVLAATTAASADAQMVTRWPAISGPATADSCQQLDQSYLALRQQLSARHDRCLMAYGQTPLDPTGPICSSPNCQQSHDELYKQWDRQHTMAMNSCNRSVEATQQRCAGTIANQEAQILASRSKIAASHTQYCSGMIAPGLRVMCERLQSEMDADDQAVSTLGDRRRAGACN